jgi:hypothetical protein
MKKEFIILLSLVSILAASLSVKAQEVTIALTHTDVVINRTQSSFIADGNWNDGNNWNTGEVPSPGSDVIIVANAIVPADYTAVANEVSLEGGSITVVDGGQLRHNTEGLMVTMKKNIEPYSVVDGTCNYYLMGFPFSENVVVPDTMTAAEGNDFYGFDPNYLYAEWRNNKEETITTIGGTTGYLYANPEAIELSLTGSTYPSYNDETKTVTIPYTEGSANPYNGWALLGNPYTCNAYVYCYNSDNELIPMDFMVYDANGDLVTLSCGPIAPMQGFFVDVTETTTVCIRNYAAPMGAINGKFTINAEGHQVYFSQGNLQYIGSAAEPYWKFADNQWDYLGTTTNQNSSNPNVDRDLFGWGTSGWNPGNTYYRPWDTNNSSGASYGPAGSNNLTDAYANSDWGVYNSISNGGNLPNQWRTLSRDEWGYVFDIRTTDSGIRFAKAVVNNVNGVILLPDDWNISYYDLNDTDTNTANFASNTISASEWDTLEQHGAVFLPAAGFRFGVSVKSVGVNCYYWSSTHVNRLYAYGVYVTDSNMIVGDGSNRTYGRSVRLVYEVE